MFIDRDRTDDVTIEEEQEKCVFVENCPKEITFEEPLYTYLYIFGK